MTQETELRIRVRRDDSGQLQSRLESDGGQGVVAYETDHDSLAELAAYIYSTVLSAQEAVRVVGTAREETIRVTIVVLSALGDDDATELSGMIDLLELETPLTTQ